MAPSTEAEMQNAHGSSLLAALALVALQPTPPTQAPAAKPFKLEQRIEQLPKLVDLDGKERALLAESEGKALVLVFWSYKDPVSRFYAPHLAELQRARAERLAVVLVDANHDELVSATDPLAKLREVVAAEKVSLPVLLDHGSALADAFGATANGQAFLLDANRFLRYHGGIDDDPKGERRAQGIPLRPWLTTAVDQVLAGERPKENWTRPAGRPIKRPPGSVPPGARKAR